MRKVYLLLTAVFSLFFLQVKSQITVTVTGNTNTTPNLLASYPNLAAALTDLNAVTAMSGPVSMALTGSEIVPPTGLTIGSASLNPALSSTNTITITGPATLTAGVGTATPASAAPDGILALNGADYITINGLTFTDGNTTNPASMEFGLGLFKRSAGDGCNNNTIQNCVFNMQSVNNALGTAPMLDGSVGILVINSTTTAATTSLSPTNGGTLATNGTNSGNKFYTNTINGGNYGIGIAGFAASSGVGPTPNAATFLGDLGNDIGGSSSGTGNSILNYGGATAASNAAAGIRVLEQWSANISYNTINNNNGGGVNHPNVLNGITTSGGTSAGITITNNTVTLKGGGTTHTLTAISSATGSTAAANTVNINNNLVTNCTYTTATSGSFTGISNSASAATVSINNNTFSNNSTSATSGAVTMLTNTGAATIAVNLNSNNINGVGFTAATSGTFTGISSTSSGAAAALSISSNNFQAITYAALSTAVNNYINCSAVPASFTCNSNTFTNLNVNTSGAVTFILMTYTTSTGTGTKTVNNNSIVTAFNRGGASGSVLGISDNGSSVTGTLTTVQNNNFSNITVAGTTTITGINLTDGGTAPTKNITGNTLNNWTAATGAINAINITYLNGISTLSTNTVTNLTGQAAITGITLGSSANNATSVAVSNNIINNLTSTGTGGNVIGITCSNTSPGIAISNHTIHTLSSTGASAVNGIVISGANAAGTSVFKNKIYNLSGSNASSTVNGISISGGTLVNAYNNIIGDLRTTAANAAIPLTGINVSGGTTVNLRYNTVWLNATSTGALFGSSAVYASSTPALEMRNNLLVNTSTPAGATGFTTAYRRTTSTLTTYASTSNNNLFYAGTPGVNNLIFYDGTNSDQLIINYRNRVQAALTATSENACATENVSFVSTTGSDAGFLHVNTGTTWVESGAGVIAGITDDYDGDIRNVSTPDIGADEINATAYVLAAPVNFTSNTITTNSFNITWDDNSVGENGFAVYRSLSGGGPWTFIGNVTSTTALTTGTTYSLPQTGLLGNTTYYFQIIPFGGPLSTNLLTGNAATANCSGGLTGTYLIPGAYASVTAALTALNTNGMSGSVIFELDPTYTGAGETYPITIPATIGCLGPSNQLTIRPASTVSSPLTITSLNTTATVDINGGKFVTIDGRPGGTGSNRYLIIENTSTTAASAGNAILLRNEASNNTLTYLDVRSGNANPSSNSGTVPATGAMPGAIAIASTSGANGNDNNTISFCNVHDTGTVAAAASLGVGIYMVNATSAGSAANNDNNTVSNCNIYDFFLPASGSAAINISAGNNNWTISNNSVYQTATRTYTGTQTVRGLWITPNGGSVPGATGTINNNFIGGTAPSCGGTAMTMTGTTAWLFQGMDISTGNTGVTSIQGNTINNINMTTASTSTTAMQGISTANGTVNIGNVTGNTFGNPAVNSAPYGITFTTTGTLGGITAFRVGGGSTGPHVVSNNIVAGIELIGNATTVAPSFVGILNAVSTANTISNNTIGSATLPNSINLSATSATSTSVSLTRGISVTTGLNTTISNNLVANINSNYSGTGSGNTVTGIQVSSGAATVSGNTIRNLYSASQSTGGGTNAGIMGISYSSTTVPAVIRGNTIFALKNTHPTTTAAIANQAIAYGGPTTGNNLIEKNTIHSIAISSPTNSAATISGMDVATGLVTIQNNMIRLGLDSNGTSIVSPCLVRGITKNTATAKIFHNSIYIGGTGVGTTATNTFAFVRTATASIDSVMNNVFVNNRSNASTGGKHYQVNLNATATLVLNNNVYYGAGTGAVFGYNGTSDVASYTSSWVATDVSSYAGDPIFINPTGNATTGDLHINPSVPSVTEGLGIALAAITDDYDGQARSGLTPVDIGADAGNFTPVAFMSLVSTTTTQANTSNVPTNSTNQQVIGIEVVTTGVVNPLSVTSLTVNTNGTTSPADIANAKIFYTGNSATFATGAQVGSTVAAPSGSFTITGTQQLLSGTNYFWLTYDIPCGAAVGNTIDAECTSITIGSAQTPAVTNPGAGRQIVAGPLSGTKTVGGGGTPDFATLTAAMTAINSFGLGGNLTLNIMGNITEPAQVVIPKWSECGGSNFTLTIKPNTTAIVTGSVASGALIKINGANKITIDGSNSGGSDRSLTLQNTTTTTSGNAVVWLASPAVSNGSSNNVVKNCIIEGNAATTTFTGIHVGGSTTIGLTTAGAELNSNNTFNNNLFRKTQYGMTLFGYGAATPDLNNVISNNNFGTATAGEGFSLIAINADRQSGLVVSGNEIQNVTNATTAATFVGGIRLLDFKNGLCYNNKIHDLSYTGTSTPKYYGIGVTSSTYTTAGNPSNAQVYNNIVYKINSTGASAVWNTTGILASAGYGDKFYYNSVHLTGQVANSSAGLVAAFANGDGNITSVGTNIDVRNNIFSLTGSSGTAGGNFWAYYTAATTLSGSVLNNNDLYCNGTNATNNVGRFNSASYATLAAWQTASSQDANSIAADPQYNGTANLVPQLGSPVLSAGTPVSVTTDILGTTRSVSTPSIGAYEIGGDAAAPVISYTALGGTCSTGDRTLTATITDATGVPTSGLLVPRIYYKKNVAGNYYSQPGTLTSGSATNGTWNFTIVAADMGGLAVNDTVYHYVVAQDIVGTPNIGSNPSGVVATNVNTITTPPTPAFYKIQSTLSGIFNVGAGQSYTTLTDAVNAYNNSCITGPVVFQLTDPLYNEAGQLVINNPTYANSTNTLTIRPAIEMVPVVNAAVANGPVVKILSGYVTIDGSSTGTSTIDMTINNTSTTAPNVVLIGSTGTTPITNVTIKNTLMVNGVNTSSGVVISDASTLGNPGYFNNITIKNDSIQKAYFGVYVNAALAAGNGNNVYIDSNKLNKSGTNALRYVGIYLQGTDGAAVRGNVIGNFETTTAENDKGIWLATGTVNTVIDKNNIINIGYTGTSGYAGHGIEVTTGLAASALRITNNMIANMYGDGDNYTSTSLYIYNPMGIALTSSTTQGGIEIYNNSIHLFGNTLNYSATSMSMGICLGYNSTANIRNNIIVNKLGLLLTTGYGATAIFAGTANTQFSAINYNDYHVAIVGSGANYIGQIATTGSATLAAWQTASGGEANSLNIAPVFVSNTDLHLVAASNCTLHRMGTPIAGLTTDFDNDTRSTAYPDMGADEYTGTISGTFTWTGTVSTDWFNPANWNNCREIPGPTSDVVIPGSLSNYPVVSANVTIKSLTAQPGSTVTVGAGVVITLLGP